MQPVSGKNSGRFFNPAKIRNCGFAIKKNPDPDEIVPGLLCYFNVIYTYLHPDPQDLADILQVIEFQKYKAYLKQGWDIYNLIKTDL